MARIAGVNIPNHQHTEIALTAIFGVGRSALTKDLRRCWVTRTAKIKDLSEAEMDRLREEVGKFTIEGDLRREVTMNIKRLMDLGLLSGCPSSSRSAASWSAYPYQRAYAQRPS
jgi:small subunit ribosomal protein S13